MGIVSFFIPKPSEAPKSPAAASTPPPTVNVPGAGSVGVGVTSGGTINIGVSPQELKAAFDAAKRGDEPQYRDLANKLNALNAKVGALAASKPAADEFSATIVHGFLATVVGKKVAESDWPRVFNELAGRFLEAGSRIASTPVTSDTIKQVVARADAARRSGDLEQADRLLEQAESQAVADADRRKQAFRESSRQAASLLASRASLAFTRLERETGAALLERAFDQGGDDGGSETVGWLIEAGDAYTTAGNVPQAVRFLVRARLAAHNRAMSDPSNSEWQTDVAVSAWNIGTLAGSPQSLAKRRATLETGLKIPDGLARRELLAPTQAGWLDLFRKAITDLQ